MRNSDIINQIFSEALGQLQQRWQETPQPPDSAPATPQSGPESPAGADELLMPPAADTGTTDDEGKENIVAQKPNADDNEIPDMPPEGAAPEEDDLDSLLEDLARSADPDQNGGDALPDLFPGDAERSGDAALSLDDFPQSDAAGDGDDDTGHSLDALLEHALGLADTPEEESENESEDSAGSETSGLPELPPEDSGDELSLDTLLGSASSDEDSGALSDDLFADTGSEEDGILPGQDLSSLLGSSNTPDDAAEDAGTDVVQTVKVPEPSVPLVEDADEELERKLAEMGLGADNLLHNSFSAGKEKLLKHLLDRFEALARRKLEPLPAQQVNLVRSVNLRVEIELKFGEFSTTGNDDSLFKLDV